MGPVSNEFFDGFSAEERIQGKTTHHPKKRILIPSSTPVDRMKRSHLTHHIERKKDKVGH